MDINRSGRHLARLRAFRDHHRKRAKAAVTTYSSRAVRELVRRVLALEYADATPLDEYEYINDDVGFSEFELLALQMVDLRAVARDFGLDCGGKGSDDLIDAIMTKGVEDDRGEILFYLDPNWPTMFGSGGGQHLVLLRRDRF